MGSYMENTEKKNGIAYLIANIVTLILPAGIIVAVMLFMHVIPNVFSAVSFGFAVIIGLIISRIIFIIRARRPSSYKIWRMILWICILAFTGFIFLFMPRATHDCKTADAQSSFEEVVSDKYPGVFNIPLSLGSPSSVEYHTYTTFAVIYASRSYTLICSYDERNFYDEINVIEFEYETRTEPFETIGDYNFFLVTTGEEDLPFFKKSAYLIVNRVTHEIGYMFYDDIDLDVANDRTSFLNRYCGWGYIR